MDNKTIKVQGIMVSVSQPYAEGHKVTEAEARALNQCYAEAIGNNQRKALTALLDEANGEVEAVQPAAQALISAYDETYEFTLASVGGSATIDPETKEARKIARDYLSALLKDAGIPHKKYLSDNGEDAIRNKIAEFAEAPEIRKAAKEAVAAREKHSAGLQKLSL